MSDDEYDTFEEEQQQIKDTFGDTNFIISIPIKEWNDLLTTETDITIKCNYKCYCYDEKPRKPECFYIEGDRLTIKYVLLELKRQGLCLDCNHHFIEGFNMMKYWRYELRLGS